MKRAGWIILVVSLLSLSGCRSHRMTEAQVDFRGWNEREAVASRWSDVQWLDTLIGVWQKQLRGRIVFWSPPDSSGRQYVRAELDLHTEEHREEELRSGVQMRDSVRMEAASYTDVAEQATYHHEQTVETRRFTWFHLVVFLVLGLMAWFYKPPNPLKGQGC